ncbi:phage baseplate assembly protein V [Pseudomonas sp. CCC4.4]|uniref:phage baseplate assembly protein V n=1 Tax=Pseudomonas sp. CCC4.4 TaxID=3048612 RepID=UPI002B228B22|nr:phage baseplate assembly protein V [Pseudomonas sp. CCC4.4]MEB0167947.1 phage baseplate assembly protein V [Pseudomonas sp. CCC4.4]
MIGQLTNALRQHQSDGSSAPRKGTISGYDPSSHSVKVTVQPEGFDTGWIQLSALGVGNGWGVVTGPQLGDEVSVSFDGGDPNLGHVTGRYFNDGAPPPAVPSGETWIVHRSGSLLKFHNDGSVEIKSAAGMTYTATQHQFHGPISVDNSVTVTGGDVVADTISLKTHHTSGVQPGSGTSGPPTP